MASWKDLLIRASHEAESQFDALRVKLKTRLGLFGPVQILPFYGFGTTEQVELRGRVLEDKGITRASDRDTVWKNLLNTYRRFESDELPGVRVELAGLGDRVEVTTDEEGYYRATLHPSAELGDGSWHEVQVRLLEEPPSGPDLVRVTAEVLIPRRPHAFGIISDIDDTVVQTRATNLLRMAQLTFLKNARSRLPFPGVSALYRALQAGPSEDQHNPLFFVSSSPWNLYDLLNHFMEIQGIPQAPLLLRDLGLEKDRFIQSSHEAHKTTQIRRILSTYPDLPFILIGDSGQHDPEIYQHVARDYPGRIRAIYIRDVTDPQRDAEVHAIARDVTEAGVPMVLATDSLQAARHAAANGLIAEARVRAVEADAALDASQPSGAEQALGLG